MAVMMVVMSAGQMVVLLVGDWVQNWVVSWVVWMVAETVAV